MEADIGAEEEIAESIAKRPRLEIDLTPTVQSNMPLIIPDAPPIVDCKPYQEITVVIFIFNIFYIFNILKEN